MQRERSKPTYDLNEAKWLARCGMFTMNRRARQFIANRYEDKPENVIKALFDSTCKDDFRKSVALDIVPGSWADVYFIPYLGRVWYVKFFIQRDGNLRLNVLSANWDGYIH